MTVDDDLPMTNDPTPAIPPSPKPRYRGGYTHAMRAQKVAREAKMAPAPFKRAINIPVGPKTLVHHPGKPKQPPSLASQQVTVQLQLQHSINEKTFGPGIVKCLPDQAAQFLNTEAAADEKERSLVTQQAFIIKFKDGLPYKEQVPWARFDSIMAGVEVPLDTMGS